MQLTIEPVRLRDEQISAASRVLARAFFDDPMTVYVEPDDVRREQILPGFFMTGVLLGHHHGEIHVPAGALDAVAVWMSPDAPELTPEHLEAAGNADRHREMSPAALERFDRVMSVWGALHERDMSEPHWYLMTLGVDPPRQGHGIGGQLIAPVHARADAAGVPCYLETAKARNLPFYWKHGFEVLVEDTMPDAGFTYWTMRRPPQA